MTQQKKASYSIGVGMTSVCNMNCIFCYSKEKREIAFDLSLSVWKEFFDRNHPFIESINFGTGENTCSEDWYKLVEHIHEKYPQIGQALTTNGTLIDMVNRDSRRKKIICKALTEIDVSLDFCIPAKHNLFRGYAGAFKMAMGTLEFCVRNNIKPTIVLLGIDETLSIPNLEGLFQIARQFNAIVRVNLYRPVLKNVKLEPAAFKSILALLDWVYEKHLILSLSDPLFGSVFSENNHKLDPSGITSFRITHEGNIYPSTYLISSTFELANINKINKVLELSNHPLLRELRELPIPEECRSCEHEQICKGGTLDRRWLWYETFNTRDPYCPKRHNYSTTLRKYRTHPDQFSSIHDNYLPTLFFKPL